MMKDCAVYTAGLFTAWLLIGMANGETHVHHHQDTTYISKSLDTFTKEHNYPGVSLAILREGKLLYSHHSGDTLSGQKLSTHTPLPISTVSNLITAVTLLKLVEQGKIDLNDKVFGPAGILSEVEPAETTTFDSRWNDINVEHLLRHSAGLDSSVNEMRDPMLNKLYLHRGHSIPDISSRLSLEGPLTSQHVIRFMLGKKLDYSPGSSFHYANLGYSILGRVLEHVTGKPYEDYVWESVLEPLGMWRTRIVDNFAEHNMTRGSYLDLVSAHFMDAASGWSSTGHDIMRLLASLDGRTNFRILTEASLKKMLSKPANGRGQSWRGLGVVVESDGGFHVRGGYHENDVVLHYKLGPNTEGSKHLSYIAIFTSNQHEYARRNFKNWVTSVKEWPEKDVLFKDLTCVQNVEQPTFLAEYKVNEMKLSAYLNAVAVSGFAPVWLHGYKAHQDTYFTVVSKKLHSPEQNVVVKSNLTKKQLESLTFELQYLGYEPSFISSYPKSTEIRHVIILSKESGDSFDVGWEQTMPQFIKRTEHLANTTFLPVVQSIVALDSQEFVSFIFKEKSRKTDYTTYHGMSLEQLQNASDINMNAGRYPSYLHSYKVESGVKFAAIYHGNNTGETKFSVLQPSLSLKEVEKETEAVNTDFFPKSVVGYDLNGRVQYCVIWEST